MIEVLETGLKEGPWIMGEKFTAADVLLGSSVNFMKKKVPSTCMGISLAAGVLCTNVLKLLLDRGEVICAPRGLHFDAYRNNLIKTWRPWGNRNPLQKYMFKKVKQILEESKDT